MAWAYDQSGVAYDQAGFTYEDGVSVAPPGGISLSGSAPSSSALLGMQPASPLSGVAVATGSLVGMAPSSSLQGQAPVLISFSDVVR